MSTKQETTSGHQEQMARGMAWLTAGNFISRLLGVIYVIPWYAWLGQDQELANGLFGMGYQVYAMFLLISTSGLPTAVAKQVAKYNVLDKEDVTYYLVRQFLKLMVLAGAVFALIMYLSSPLIADLSGTRELVPVLYSLVPPLLLFPAMSVMRGFFQGVHDLKPYALSQIAEQIVRVIWILAGTFFVMKLGSGDYHEAVVQSTFAAFVGMIASVIVLYFALQKAGYLSKIFGKNSSKPDVDIKALVFETIKEAIPIIIIGTAFQIFQLIDQFTFVNFMEVITSLSNKTLLSLYAYMLTNPSKITMLIISITGSIGSVAIPLITERYIKGNKQATADLITDNLQMLFVFVVPAIVGTVILAVPLYNFFYGTEYKAVAIPLFQANLVQIIVLGLYSVLGVAIQAIFQNRKAVYYFLTGLLIKVIIQYPFIYLFKEFGPILASTVGLGVSVILFYRCIHKVVPIQTGAVVKDLKVILLMSAIMGVVVALLEYGLLQFVSVDTRVNSAIHLVLVGGIGMLLYLLLSLKTRQLDRLIGGRADSLRRTLHIS